MATVTINGVSVSGTSVQIRNGRVIVDGEDVTPEGKTITIEVHGDVNSIDASSCDSIRVTGSVGDIKTMSGDIHCGDVTGSVKTMSGDITCGAVGGSASSMSGDVRHL